MLVPGSIVGDRYQIIQKLSKKEVGRIYLVKDLQATGDSRCALEQLNPNYHDKADWQVIKQHLLNEVAVLQRLGDHPQIPQLYNDFIEARQFYLVREYIDGDSLETIVERKEFNEVDAIGFIQDALRILDFVHKTNIIHRDVQPANFIRRKKDNSFVLINFGAIREIESTEINLKGELVSRKSLGNWSYIAPEQKDGQSQFSSDIYALGKSAVYALTGRSPTELEQTKVDWRDRCQISPKLKDILAKMMVPDPNYRYGSAIDVLQDLKPLLKINQTLGGRYLVTRYLGGNLGVETYLADNLHRQYQSPCLIKQIELPNVHNGGKVRIERRFAEELAILERLGYHDQIPQLWDHFEENDDFCLVQEYIQGENLGERISQHSLATSEVVKILASTLSVLDFIHQNRIIHRNIKPSNLLIRYENQQVALVDFGILMDIKNPSNMTADPSQQNDRKNYWSPEQLAGRPTIGSDLYALGMSTVEILTRVQPGNIAREKQTGKLQWQKHLQDGKVDRRLARVIDKLIDLNLGNRYSSAEKALEDLQKVNLMGKSNVKLKKSAKQIQDRPKNYRAKLPGFIAIGVLGVASLLGSIEFAFPTVRPAYYGYLGNKALAEQPRVALDTFTKAIDLKPQSASAWAGRGAALLKLERYSQSLEAYAEATELNPNDWQSWKKQGTALLKLERFQQAIAVYDRALEVEKNDGELYNQRGKALYELQDYKSALAMQEEALGIDRLNPIFLSDRAENLIQLGRYYDALSVLNRVQVSQPYKMQLWQDKARVLRALDRPKEEGRVNQEIAQNYKKLLQEQPRNEKAWFNQGNFLVSRNMYSKAIESYQIAVEIRPDFYRGWLALGKALTKNGQNQSALEALDQALEIRPKSYLAWQAKGMAYQESLIPFQAIASYDRGIAINSEYAPLWRDRGLAFNQQGNYSLAIESLSRASELASQDAKTWSALATAWNNTGQDTQALLALDRAIEINPNNPQAWSQKGQIYTQNAQYNEACETYRQSLPVITEESTILTSMRSLGCRMN